MKFFVVLALCIVSACAAPLSAEDAAIVQSSWAHVSHNEVEILANFFQQHPEHQSRFPAFVGKDLNSLKDSAKFATHATRIVSELTEVIQLLGNSQNLPAIKTVLNELGFSHKNRGISKEAFNDFRASLISYLKAHVAWDDNVEHAWNNALDNSLAIIFSSIDGKPVQ